MPKPRELSAKQAMRLAELSLSSIDREFPYKSGHVQERADDHRTPREMHPIFFGCYDWHSAVHGHWALLRVLRRFPLDPLSPQISARLDAHFNKKAALQEARYFTHEPSGKTFERPYGMAWFFRLMAELEGHPHPHARAWKNALRPLEDVLLKKFMAYPQAMIGPVRRGVHENTAFAFVHAWDYAKITRNQKLQDLVARYSKVFYLADRDYPLAYEPSADDFISPCLATGELMSRVLSRPTFKKWWGAYFPKKGVAPFLKPVAPKDLQDYKHVHLVGLCFQKAWALTQIAETLGRENSQNKLLLQAADLHRSLGMRLTLKSGYGGTHWLASFALYDLTV